MVQSCQVCRLCIPTPVEPLCSSSLPERVRKRQGADLITFNNDHYLVVVDYFSYWIEVCKLSSLGSQTTIIEAMKLIFATHVVCKVPASDNGPQFASLKFQNFIKENGFLYATSFPLYPKVNGQTERAVGVVKKLWSKTSDPYMSLMVYHATPLKNGYSLSELLMGSLILTTLPTLPDNLQSFMPKREDITEHEEHHRQKAKQTYNRRHHAHKLTELKPQDRIHIRDMGKEAVVQEKAVRVPTL